jgi:hypothetical protein
MALCELRSFARYDEPCLELVNVDTGAKEIVLRLEGLSGLRLFANIIKD